MANKLNARQLKFAQAYAIEDNGTKACVAAGFRGRNLAVYASKMLRVPKISDEINRLRAIQEIKTSITTGVTRDKVINELAKIAFADMKNYVDGDNSLRSVAGMENEESAAISSIEFTETPGLLGAIVKKKFGLWDKNKALEMLAKHFGLFEVDNNQKRAAIQINYLD